MATRLFLESKILKEKGEIKKAYQVINYGLENVPDERYLLNFKFKILKENWKEDNYFFGEARKFFETNSEIYQNDNQSRYELAKIYHSEDNDTEAIKKMIEILNNCGFKIDVEDLKQVNITCENLFKFYKVGKEYFKYFKKHSTTPEIENRFDLNKQIKDLILLIFGIIYSNIYNEFYKLDKINIDSLIEIHKYATDLFIEKVELIAELITLDCKEKELEKNSKLISNMIVFLPEIILKELFKQIGNIAMIFNVKDNTLDNVLSELEYLDELRGHFYEPILMGANKNIQWYKGNK